MLKHFGTGVLCALATVLSLRPAHAGVLVDLRAVSISGGSGSIGAGGKSVFVSGPGATVSVGVWAQISGLNSAQQTGDIDANSVADLRNDDFLLLLSGSFKSSFNGLSGNMNSAAGTVSYETRVAPFAAAGSQKGVAVDIDG